MLCGKLLWRSPHHFGPVDPTARTVGNRKIEFGTCLNGSSRPGRHGFQTKQQLYWFVPRRIRHQALNLHALHTYQQHTDTERSDRKIKIKTKGNQRGSTTTQPTNLPPDSALLLFRLNCFLCAAPSVVVPASSAPSSAQIIAIRVARTVGRSFGRCHHTAPHQPAPHMKVSDLHLFQSHFGGYVHCNRAASSRTQCTAPHPKKLI